MVGSVDVVLLTKDSERVLIECVESIYRNVPVGQLIDWYKKAQKYMQSDVGAVWGTEVWSTIKNPKTLKLFLTTTRKIFEVRGGTHDTLIRTDLLKDIEIPKNLHVFEDAYIKDWITEKGYCVVACYSPFCIHYGPPTVWTFPAVWV